MGKIFNFLVTFNLLALPLTLHANTVTTSNCPEKYIGTVKKITDTDLYSLIPKIEVEFEITETLKGESVSLKTFKVVKDGPSEFKVGKSYEVNSNAKFLCGTHEEEKI